MSSQAVAWAYRHSPYEHGTFAVHQALADAANDLHDNELWFRLEKLAAKARVRRSTAQSAVKTMVKDGYLETVRARGGPGSSAVYRFVFVADAPVVFRQENGSPDVQILDVSEVQDLDVKPNLTSKKLRSDVQKANSSPLIEPNRTQLASRGRSTRVPEDFTVTDDMRQWAQSRGIRSDVDEETDRFVDHWTSKGETRVDWVASWRNWMRNADRFGAGRSDPAQSKSTAARARVRAQLQPGKGSA